MEIKAYAKINLGLDVLGRRSDGYHEVRMIMQNIGLSDVLSFEKTKEPGIRIYTEKEELPVNEDNLIFKAARLLMDEFNISEGIEIRLEKNIPIAAGLAGGSTDAAATLKAVNELWNLSLSAEDLMKRGVKIGADVPYCILGKTAVSEGIGEILTPITPCPFCYVLIAKPPVGVSTKYVYEHLEIDKLKHPDIDGIISGIEDGSIKRICDNLGNVLESVTVSMHPVIEKIKSLMKNNGAENALMSGSGPTVFGLFSDENSLKRAYKAVLESELAGDVILTDIYTGEQ